MIYNDRLMARVVMGYQAYDAEWPGHKHAILHFNP